MSFDDKTIEELEEVLEKGCGHSERWSDFDCGVTNYWTENNLPCPLQQLITFKKTGSYPIPDAIYRLTKEKQNDK